MLLKFRHRDGELLLRPLHKVLLRQRTQVCFVLQTFGDTNNIAQCVKVIATILDGGSGEQPPYVGCRCIQVQCCLVNFGVLVAQMMCLVKHDARPVDGVDWRCRCECWVVLRASSAGYLAVCSYDDFCCGELFLGSLRAVSTVI